MFVYIYLILSFCCFSCPFDVLSVLWDDDDYDIVASRMGGKSLENSDNVILVHRLSQLPFTDYVKSSAWYKILKDRTASSLDIDEWSQYEALIPYIPPDLLLDVNFTDEEIFKFLGKQELGQKQLSMIAEKMALLQGANILEDPQKILSLKNIFCGFSPDDLAKIKAHVFRYYLENLLK